MVIKASSTKQIDALVVDLSAGAVVASGAPAAARVAALCALEAIGDPRALAATLHLIDDPDPNVASAAASAARPFLRGPHGTAAVDRLTATALDTARDPSVRMSAIQALAALEPSTLKPLWLALRDDPHGEVRAFADERTPATRPRSGDSLAALTRAAEGGPMEDPTALRGMLARAGDRAALPLVHRVVERLREQEASEPSAARRAEWMRARAAAHMALAHRGSRLAVYDLRESLESAEAALPVEFLAALTLVGDASCLQPIAAAYARADNAWWRQHLADTFRAIVKREKITRRHAVMKKIQKRWAAVASELAGLKSGKGR